MTAYQCARHGEYTRSQFLPDHVPAKCSQCQAEFDSACDEAQAQLDREARVYAAWVDADLPQRYQNRTLENWVPRAGQEGAARMVRTWLDSGDSDGLLLMGAPGVGKTHLLAALVTAIVERGYGACYASWPSVWEKCKPPFDQEPEALLRRLAEVPVLALDELGLRTSSEKEQARLFELIDSRYRNELPMLVATNATQATLKNVIGERAADRLLEACIPVVIPGSSNRATAAVDQTLRQAPVPVPRPAPRTIKRDVCVAGVMETKTWTSKRSHG